MGWSERSKWFTQAKSIEMEREAKNGSRKQKIVPPPRFELGTSRLLSVRSDQLSYGGRAAKDVRRIAHCAPSGVASPHIGGCPSSAPGWRAAAVHGGTARTDPPWPVPTRISSTGSVPGSSCPLFAAAGAGSVSLTWLRGWIRWTGRAAAHTKKLIRTRSWWSSCGSSTRQRAPCRSCMLSFSGRTPSYASPPAPRRAS